MQLEKDQKKDSKTHFQINPSVHKARLSPPRHDVCQLLGYVVIVPITI